MRMIGSVMGFCRRPVMQSVVDVLMWRWAADALWQK